MNAKLSTLLKAAVVSGLFAHAVAHAEAKPAATSTPEQMADGKNKCKGEAEGEKNKCKANAKGMTDTKPKKDKNSCKNGCGAAKK